MSVSWTDGLRHVVAAHRAADQVMGGKNVLSTIQLTKQYVCEIQGQLAQFEFLAGRRHKMLRHALARAKQNPTPELIKQLGLSRDSLDEFITLHQMHAGETTISHLLDYFRNRCSAAKFLPRICLKLQVSTGIYTLLRSENNGATGIGSKVNDVDVALNSNTGFRKVFETGSPYRENDIPQKAAIGDYINLRLNSAAAKNYSSTWTYRFKNILPGTNPDLNWIHCWNDEATSNPRDCYKSTLIVPMTLMGHTLHPEFAKNFASNLQLQSDANQDRAKRKKFSFGFLCVDSHHTDFFESWDEDYCFIYADLFSLFLIQGYSLREYSLKFDEATKLLDQYPNWRDL